MKKDNIFSEHWDNIEVKEVADNLILVFKKDTTFEIGDTLTIWSSYLTDKYKELIEKDWKPIDSYFYFILDKKRLDGERSQSWIKMYEQLKYDLLEDKQNYRFREINGEIEIKKLI